MRPILRLALPFLALLAWTNIGAAQTTPLAPPENLWAGGTGGAVDGAMRDPVELPAERWHTDLLLGVPTGLRCQGFLGDDGRNAFVVEGFAGLALIFPALGGGVRYRCTPVHEGGQAFRISPGIDVYGVYFAGGNDSYLGGGSSAAATIITGDVDFSWEGCWYERFGGELGLKVGGGAAFVHRDTYFVPVLSLYAGFHF